MDEKTVNQIYEPIYPISSLDYPDYEAKSGADRCPAAAIRGHDLNASQELSLGASYQHERHGHHQHQRYQWYQGHQAYDSCILENN